MTVLFESPWPLLTVAAVTLVIAGLIRQIRPDWKWIPFLLPLLLTLAAFGLDRIVQTDREQITQIIRQCRHHAVNRNIEGIAEHIAENYYDTAHPAKQSLVQNARQIINSTAVTRIAERSHTITIQNGTAESLLDLRVHVDPQQSAYPGAGSLLFVSFKITYTRQTDESWKISRVELTNVNNSTMDWSDVR